MLDAMKKFDRACRESDTSLAAEAVHDDFALVLVQPTPAVVPRDRWMEMLPEYLIHEWIVEETRTDVDRECATVHQRVAMKATVMGEDRSGIFVITDVWRDGLHGWRLWRRFSTPMTAGEIPS